jgi:hypothetical protein
MIWKIIQLGLLLCGVINITGCYSPCRSLADRVCLELGEHVALCRIARNESLQTDISMRNCLALLDNWPKHGQHAIRGLRKSYEQTQTQIARWRYRDAQKRISDWHLVFRKQYRQLLRFSLPQKAK